MSSGLFFVHFHFIFPRKLVDWQLKITPLFMTKRILTAILKSKYFIGSDLSDVEQAIMSGNCELER
jgi:hypothetical protein